MWKWLRAQWIATEGARFLDNQQYEKAVEVFSEAIRLHPREIDFYIKRASAYEKLKNLEAALADYAKGIEIEPSRIDILFKRVRTYQALNLTAEALQELTDLIHYTQSTKQSTYHASALLERAEMYRRLQEWENLRSDLTEYAQSTSIPDPRVYLLWTIYWIQREDHSMALESASQIIHDPQLSATAYSLRGVVYQGQGKLEQAVSEYTKALKVEPDNLKTLSNRCLAHFKAESWQAATADVEKLIHLDPDPAPHYTTRAYIYSEQKQYNEALSDWSTAIDLKPNNWVYYSNRANVHFSMQNYPVALADFQKSQELKPDTNRVKAGIAVTHHALGNLEEAHRLWRELMASDEHYQAAAWAGEQHHWLPALIEEAKKLIAGMNI